MLITVNIRYTGSDGNAMRFAEDTKDASGIPCVSPRKSPTCGIGRGANGTVDPIRADVHFYAGSVVTHDVPDDVVVAGNPARVIKKNN